MHKRFAFILMGPTFDPDTHRAVFMTPDSENHMRTVRSFEEAKALVCELHKAGFGCIELCGAFGEARAKQIIDLTGGEVAVGFVTHTPDQDSLFERFFGR